MVVAVQYQIHAAIGEHGNNLFFNIKHIFIIGMRSAGKRRVVESRDFPFFIGILENILKYSICSRKASCLSQVLRKRRRRIQSIFYKFAVKIEIKMIETG